MAGLRAEKALSDAMDNVAPVPQRRAELQTLFDCLADAVAKLADPKLVMKGQAVKRTKEAELKLWQVFEACKQIECASDEWRPKMAAFAKAIVDAKKEGGSPTLVQEAEILRTQLRCELELQHSILPPTVRERLDDGTVPFARCGHARTALFDAWF